MVVTNACAPDPRVERHALWLTELGHDVEIHAWDDNVPIQFTKKRMATKLYVTDLE